MVLKYKDILISYSTRRKTKITETETLFYCCDCHQYLPIDHFELRSESKNKETKTLRSQCKKCRNEESRLYHYMNRKHDSEMQAKRKMQHWDNLRKNGGYALQYHIWQHSKNKAAYEGREFNLDVEDIIIPEKCPILETPFILKDKDFAPSVDRIDNSKGYIKGNVAVISKLANTMKNRATCEQLKMFSKNITNYIKK